MRTGFKFTCTFQPLNDQTLERFAQEIDRLSGIYGSAPGQWNVGFAKRTQRQAADLRGSGRVQVRIEDHFAPDARRSGSAVAVDNPPRREKAGTREDLRAADDHRAQSLELQSDAS